MKKKDKAMEMAAEQTEQAVEQTVDVKVLGAELHRVRRARGLSMVAFASRLGKPTWLIDVLEHVEDEISGNLCSLLPPQEIEEVQVQLEKLQGEAGPGADAEVPEGRAPAEQTFYIPVTISADNTMDVIDQILLFVSDEAERSGERKRCLQQGVVAAELMLQLLHSQYKCAGRNREARQCLKGFREKLQKRIRKCG